MTISEVLLSDFDGEVRSTLRVLERVSDGKNDWQPHDKSMSLIKLGRHVASLPQFGHTILTTPLLDMAVTPFPIDTDNTTAELVATATKSWASLREVLAAATDEELLQNWTLRFGDNVIATIPRHIAYRTMFFNHLVHHRGQLTVYLRLLDAKVPGIYGPSADEPFMG